MCTCSFLFLIIDIVALLLCSNWVSHGYLQNERICVLSLIQEHAVDLHSMGGGLQVTNKGCLAFPIANNRQGQLQTPQSVTVEGTAEFRNVCVEFIFTERMNVMTTFLTLSLSDEQEGPTVTSYRCTVM